VKQKAFAFQAKQRVPAVRAWVFGCPRERLEGRDSKRNSRAAGKGAYRCNAAVDAAPLFLIDSVPFKRSLDIQIPNKVKPLARTPPPVFGLGFGCLGRAWKEGSRRGTAEQQEKEHIEVDDVVFQSCNMGINRSNVRVLAIGRVYCVQGFGCLGSA